MMTNEPIVGQWYQDMQERMFEVVASDEDTVEIQFYDGDVEEMDMDTWYQLSLNLISEPNDASGPYDDLELGDFGSHEEPPGDWQDHLDEL